MTETINVNGSGEVTSEPEAAEVTVGISVEHEEVAKVRTDLARRYEELENSLLDESFEEDDIVTAGYAVRHRPPREENDVETYHGSHTVQVSVGNVDAVESAIDTALSSGATEIDDVKFTLTDETRRACRDEAIQLAVDEARHDAAATAEAADRVLGDIVDMGVDRARVSPSQHSGEALALASTHNVDTSIQSGNVSVSVTVSASYELRHE